MSTICLQLLSKMPGVAFAFTCLPNVWQSGYSDWARPYRYFWVVRPKARTPPGLRRIQPGWRTRALNKVAIHSSKHVSSAPWSPLGAGAGQKSDVKPDEFLSTFSVQRGERGTCRGWTPFTVHPYLAGVNTTASAAKGHCGGQWH